MPNTTSSAQSLGTCWGTPQGQDLSSPSYMASGLQAVGEAILRRWTTTPGDLIYDRSYGYNITDLIGADLSPADINYAQQQAAAQAQLDERVFSCTVTLTLPVTGVLTVVAKVVTASGPFRMIVTISTLAQNGGAYGVQLLLVTP